MPKTIIAVYQDCFLCGSNKEKGEKMLEAIAKKGATFRKLSFATMEGQDYCAKAVENGIKTMPFFTDGKIYAQDYETLLEAESRAQNEQGEAEPQAVKIKATAEPKKTKKTKKEANNESVQEA